MLCGCVPNQSTTELADENRIEPHQRSMIWTQVFWGRDVMERIITTMGNKEQLLTRFYSRYVMRAAMAGVICTLMYIFAYQVKAELGPEFNPALRGLATATAFSFALPLIYFTNSELLTSNFMYFTVGVYYRKVSLRTTAQVLGSCLLGNLLGILGVAALVRSSQMVSADLIDNVMHTVELKTVGTGAWVIFVRAIFANYFINVSVIVAMQVKESLAKIVVLSMSVVVFAFMGYEHVVANAALFVLALFHDAQRVDLLHTAKNFVMSLAGNYVGGGLVIGLFYAYLNDDRTGD
jgi:formate/nitrite transporter FocA (FNT family)